MGEEKGILLNLPWVFLSSQAAGGMSLAPPFSSIFLALHPLGCGSKCTVSSPWSWHLEMTFDTNKWIVLGKAPHTSATQRQWYGVRQLCMPGKEQPARGRVRTGTCQQGLSTWSCEIRGREAPRGMGNERVSRYRSWL